MQMKHQSEKNINQRLQNIRVQRMFKVSASGPKTHPQPGTPLVNRIVDDRLPHAAPRFLTGAARFKFLIKILSLLFKTTAVRLLTSKQKQILS